ncbi:hypothetical protein JHK85_010494 [Glycine max]|nr:hypothetical protein JHK85_010494 [Glycine max]
MARLQPSITLGFVQGYSVMLFIIQSFCFRHSRIECPARIPSRIECPARIPRQLFKKRVTQRELACTEVDPDSKIGAAGSIVGLESALTRELELEFESVVGSTEVGLATELLEDAGSGIALKTLKRVQKAWGQESISSLQPQQNDFLDYYDGSG